MTTGAPCFSFSVKDDDELTLWVKLIWLAREVLCEEGVNDRGVRRVVVFESWTPRTISPSGFQMDAGTSAAVGPGL